MKSILRANALAILVCLTACNTVKPVDTAATTEASDAVTPLEPAAITGSRIPAKRTEKMVAQIGSKDYQESKAAMPAPLRTP